MFTSFVNLKDKNTTSSSSRFFSLLFFSPASTVFSMDLIKHEENMNTPEDLKP